MPTEAPAATVLVVDDDQGLLRLIQKALKREGFSVAVANSGKEAIQWLTRNTADLMLLDLKLQDIEGKELVNHLTDVNRSVPFIVITGQGDERVAVDMMKRGALDYLVKDVDFLQFVPEVVRRALKQLQKDKALAAMQAALADSQKEVLAISDREQRRFGAELHDGLGQQLTAIELMCQSLKEDLRSAPPDVQKQISKVCQFMRDAIAQTRALARGLSPVNLGSSGLAEAFSELALQTSETGRIKCVFNSASPIVVKDPVIAGHLFRIAQEAVNNAVKHSKATRVTIDFSQRDGVLRLQVADNGKGMPKDGKQSEGMGLHVMRHRAGIIGGSLEVLSEAGKGVTVTCKL